MFIALALLTLPGCGQNQEAPLDESGLTFVGPADPKGYQAPPTIAIVDESAQVARHSDYGSMLQCAASIAVLRKQLERYGSLDDQQRMAVNRASSLVNDRLRASAAEGGKGGSDVSAELADAVTSATERPGESVREALGCIQRVLAAA